MENDMPHAQDDKKKNTPSGDHGKNPAHPQTVQRIFLSLFFLGTLGAVGTWPLWLPILWPQAFDPLANKMMAKIHASVGHLQDHNHIQQTAIEDLKGRMTALEHTIASMEKASLATNSPHESQKILSWIFLKDRLTHGLPFAKALEHLRQSFSDGQKNHPLWEQLAHHGKKGLPRYQKIKRCALRVKKALQYGDGEAHSFLGSLIQLKKKAPKDLVIHSLDLMGAGDIPESWEALWVAFEKDRGLYGTKGNAQDWQMLQEYIAAMVSLEALEAMLQNEEET